jgi:hypothetical protein
MNGRDQKKTLGIEVVLLTPLKPQLFLEENTSKKKKNKFLCVAYDQVSQKYKENHIA